MIFQSTLPRGSDVGKRSERLLRYHFNPRSLAGATMLPFLCVANIGISIHAPSRERLQALRKDGESHYFNPRSLAGATSRQSLERGLESLISIHAPSRERQCSRQATTNTTKFQSTLPRGSDNSLPVHFFFRRTFQSTLPRGSDAIIRFTS